MWPMCIHMLHMHVYVHTFIRLGLCACTCNYTAIAASLLHMPSGKQCYRVRSTLLVPLAQVYKLTKRTERNRNKKREPCTPFKHIFSFTYAQRYLFVVILGTTNTLEAFRNLRQAVQIGLQPSLNGFHFCCFRGRLGPARTSLVPWIS